MRTGDLHIQVCLAEARACRWLVFTSSLLSVLLLVHLYLVNWSLEKSYLDNVFLRKVWSEQLVDKLKGNLLELNAITPIDAGQYPQEGDLRGKLSFIEKYGAAMLRRDKNDKNAHSLLRLVSKGYTDLLIYESAVTTMTLKTRRIPVLDIDVPYQDYEAILSLLAVLSMLWIWQSMRFIARNIKRLSETDATNAKDLGELFFIVPLASKDGSRFHRGTRLFFSFWLPFLAVTLTLVSAVYSGILTEVFSRHSATLTELRHDHLRWLIVMTLCWLLVGVTAWSCTRECKNE